MTTEELAEAAKCYCYDRVTMQKVKIYLLAQIAGLGAQTPEELEAAAKCYCFDPITQKKVEAYLLNQIASQPA